MIFYRGRFDVTAATFLPASATGINISGGGTAAINNFLVLPGNTGFSVTAGQLTLANTMFVGSNGVGTMQATAPTARVIATAGVATIFGAGTGVSATATFSSSAVGTFSQLSLATSS